MDITMMSSRQNKRPVQQQVTNTQHHEDEDEEADEEKVTSSKNNEEKKKEKKEKKSDHQEIYELKNGDLSVKFTNWGATIMSLTLPDKHGKLGDVVLGYDKVKNYKKDTVYFGSIVGRVANRIGKSQFKVNGKQYKTNANEGANTLHGGKKGFSDVLWTVQAHQNESLPHIVFAYNSTDNEQGFPGDLQVIVNYTLIEKNQLSVVIRAKALNKATPVNLAQHSYWNLGGHDSGNILSEEVQIFASKYTPVDSKLIPTGEIVTVKGTPFDFLKPHTIGSTINKLPKGYDINYALDGPNNGMKKAAIVIDKRSGRKMELLTNQPGVQFYTGNMLNNVKGKGGVVYNAHAGLCLETQGYPDSVNHPKFPSQIVNSGQTYEHLMLYKFSVVS
ncbi:aldose 1-epimerase-like [Carica papaya]|uniref:aldose 1-epimerase-like n=1 Tax=Carica papaya TaxID=3649 RepID=UPI000B8C719C|nr:aldose 1-epimerase-like [Carica papaya]